MYFWCICGEEGDLHILPLCHLEGLLHNLLIKVVSGALNWIFIWQRGNFLCANSFTAVQQKLRDLHMPTKLPLNVYNIFKLYEEEAKFNGKRSCSSEESRDGSHLWIGRSIPTHMNGNDFLSSVQNLCWISTFFCFLFFNLRFNPEQRLSTEISNYSC